MYDVTAIGEALIDFACKDTDHEGYPLMKANPGGAPGNLLAALNAYGCRTAFIGKVGTDAFGKLLISTLQKSGTETKGMVSDDRVFTTLAFVTFDKTGNRSFSFARKPGADTCLSFDEVDLSLIDDCRDFHFGTLSLTDEPVRTATQKSVEYAKKAGKIISFDPNLRAPLWKDLEEARKQILWGLSKADIVKISDEEVNFLWHCTAEEAGRKLIQEYHAKLAFITLGPDGCYFTNGAVSGRVTAPPEIKVVDTTGAGDIFGGSVLSRVLQLKKPLDQITLAELTDAAEFACTAASLSTENYGGISSVPPIEQVNEMIRKGR